MAKKRQEEVIGNIRLVCQKWKWTGFKDSCDRILSVQNCLHFFGDYQPCDCFSMKELDIKERELEKIGKMIIETEDPFFLEKEDIEVSILDSDEPPLEDRPKKKRRRRRKLKID